MNGLLHLVGRFDDPLAGADRSALALGHLLSDRVDVRCWSDGAAHPWFLARGVRPINAVAGDMPKGGTLVFSGVHVKVERWLELVLAERVVVRYNLPNHGALFAMIEQIRDMTGHDPEIVFVSRALQTAVGLPGRVEPSMIQLDDFLAVPLGREGNRPFTIGRASRDVPEKHHPEDPVLYLMLAAQGHRVRIMGGSCMQAALGGVPGIDLLPAGAESMPDFFASLDVMFYRTGSFYEAYGRVIFEAMASGLPVVASASGGYAESVFGDNGVLLFRTQEEALRALQALASDRVLRQLQAIKARERSKVLHGNAAIQAYLASY